MAGTASRRGFNATPLRLLILAHKADQLSRDASALSPPDLAPQTRQTAEERVRSVLTREMDRLKSARWASGGRIEGMGRVATQRGWWARLFGSAEPVAENTEDEEALVWGGPGAWNWDDVEGVDVEWGVTGLGGAKPLTDELEEGDGLQDLTDFFWDL
jgi:signal recognition particle receptor subunit beta